ncbi:hypothetical protein PIB30_058030 [Stylosanthes scabra]|uniref:Uncharacterized protein n=1 Tax=Stylosanthes scabra TaxID=79078 RepID=A0ABU6UJC0_9FABA|nr:hypothetical protein [Stylosanthes scabra]
MERGKVTNTSHHHHHHHTYINPNSPPTTNLQHNYTSFPTHLPHHSNSTLTIFNAQKYFNQVTTATTSNSNTRVSPVVANMNSQQHNNNNNNNEEVAKKKKNTISSPPSSLHGCAITRNFIPHSLFQASTTKSATATETEDKANRNNRFNKPKPENRASHCLYTKAKPTWILRKCPCFCKKSVQVKQPATTPTPNPKSKTPITKIPSKSQLQPPEQKITNIEKAVTIPITPPNVTENCKESQQPDTDTVLGKPSSTTTEGFTFPSLASATTTTTNTSGHGKKQVLNVVHEEYPIPPRHSLEVFQPAIITVDRDSSRESNNNNNNRRRNMTSPPSPLSRDGDDAASDASSDLFEIESFSVQAVAALLTSPPSPPVTVPPPSDNNNKSSAVELRLATGAGNSGGSERSADKSMTIGGDSTK